MCDACIYYSCVSRLNAVYCVVFQFVYNNDNKKRFTVKWWDKFACAKMSDERKMRQAEMKISIWTAERIFFSSLNQTEMRPTHAVRANIAWLSIYLNCDQIPNQSYAENKMILFHFVSSNPLRQTDTTIRMVRSRLQGNPRWKNCAQCFH